MSFVDRFFPAFVLVLCGLGLSGCLRPDEAVLPYQPAGDVLRDVAPMGKDYVYQVFFDLGTGQQLSVPRNRWDLAFSTDPAAHHLLLNSANYMDAAWGDSYDLQAVTAKAQLSDLAFDFDLHTGNPDSSVAGRWWEQVEGKESKLLIVNRGRGADLRELGYVKLKVELVAGGYKVRYAQLDGSGEHSVFLQKDETYNYVFLSLETHAAVAVEPPKTDWDLVFTYYSYRFPDDIPYLVTGVLSNRYQVLSAEADSVFTFESFALEDTASLALSDHIDEIGYDWKTYLFDPPGYVVYAQRLFVVRDTEGYYYKLRFTGFYNDAGEKGYPAFEYVRL